MNLGQDSKQTAHVSNTKIPETVIDNPLYWQLHKIKCSLLCSQVCQATCITWNTEKGLLLLFAFHYDL
jgi:hypothetical protein